MGNLNGDAAADVVTSHQNDNLQVLFNTGTGALASPINVSLAGSPDVMGVTLANLDGDADLDLLAVLRSPNELSGLMTSEDYAMHIGE